MPCVQDAVCGAESNILQGTTLEVVSFQGVVALKREVYVNGVLNNTGLDVLLRSGLVLSSSSTNGVRSHEQSLAEH
jgi:hypothetical protein